ncbi:PREDICTED: protein FATTY ACID EXPORT 2, chloroplastic-like isoform X1 [Tarenaya hassleriana]|uniref:protein FATTY ACID EXPORT 2, chloroplastic-like isoform X1 n=1 Tax=Tarenaya hassleriana TaxID=28532 RepID=UPI00053CA6B8|nr:PREDICTED: protein FATTY ACID EXPORT 2, chloroplastic-like isoform X1 [Tarenaya hassleriana]
MADLLLGSSAQSSLLHLRPKLRFTNSTSPSIQRLSFLKSGGFRALAFASDHRRCQFGTIAVADLIVPLDSTILSTVTSVTANGVDSGIRTVEIESETGGGGDGGDQLGGGGGGGGGGGSGDGDGGKQDGDGEESQDDGKGKMGLSMSQKLTLGYAALVGVGGLMGYLKSGSQKSLLAGGLSAAVLFYVFRELPTKPVLASTVGVAMAAALTWMMGTRFMRSKKIFPAGVVSFVSFIMTGGYIHGIMRSFH